MSGATTTADAPQSAGAEATWLSFVPGQLIRDGESLVGRERRFDAVTLFADISGFTPMSEALGKTGRRGTEELTAILNTYFAPTVDLITSYGGVVAKFGGDSLTVLFPFAPRSRRPAVRRAVTCALEMQASMEAYGAIATSAGVFGLSIKIGIALGPVFATSVGEPGIRLEFVIGGRAIDRCCEAEHHAEPGEILVDAAVLEVAPGTAVARRSGSFAVAEGLARRAKPSPPTRQEEHQAGVVSAVRPYLHPSVAERIGSHVIDFLNEHRKVTILFGRFEDFDYEHDPDIAATLQEHFGGVIGVVDRYGGHLVQVDIGDKGSTYLAVFGTPIAHEDDERRAVRCALELRNRSGVRSAIGLNTGFVFCGCVGSDVRRAYTVMGDAVNVSARLMSAARPAQVLAGAATTADARGAAAWEALEPLILKGKAEPVLVYEACAPSQRPLADLHEPAASSRLIGRSEELGRADGIVDAVLADDTRVFAIAGEAGVGKSRLLAEIGARAIARGFSANAGACESLAEGIAYQAWRSIWRGLLGLDAVTGTRQQIEHVQVTLAAADPAWVSRSPLLASVLNIPIPDNELTRTFDPRLRAESRHSLLLALLRSHAVVRPQLLALEDCHWIDPSSLELLEFLARGVAGLPVLFLIAYRPAAGDDSLAGLRLVTGFEELQLGTLGRDETRELLRLRLEGKDGGDVLPGALAEQLIEKSDGNPFYLEELVEYVSELGTDAGSAALEAVELPGSLHSLVLARIDQLREPEKATLRVASVIGRAFRARWVSGSYPPLGGPEEVGAHLETLSRLELTPLDRVEPELQYVFKHVTTQEVAYGSLAFSTRELLHERVGTFVEETYSDSLDQYVDVLAHHFGRSANTDKQRVYFRRAGAVAKAAYANEAAIRYHERLLPLLAGNEKSAVLCELGDVLQLVGRWTEADESYRQALELAETAGSEQATARAEAAVGRLLSFTNSFAEGVTWLERARTRLERLEARHELAAVLEHLATTYFWQSDYDRALGRANEHLTLADELGDSGTRSAAEENLGLIHWHQGDHERARVHFEEALRLARSGDHKVAVVNAANDAAGLFWERGDYARALEHLGEALETAIEIGYERVACSAISNAGRVRLEHGDTADALACYAHALALAVRLAFVPGIHPAVAGVALVCVEWLRDDDAERLLDGAIAVARAAEDRWWLADYLLQQARVCFRAGRLHEGQRLAEEALEIGSVVNPREMELPARLLLIRLRVASGELPHQDATAILEQLAKDCPEPADRAAVLFELSELTRRRDSRDVAAGLYRELYASMPKAEFRRRYELLAGETLPAPPPLPLLPADIARAPRVTLDDVVEQAALVSRSLSRH